MNSTEPQVCEHTRYFYDLTPDRVLDAVEKSLAYPCTGRLLPLNSMENRVYDIELTEAPLSAVVAKFYRPGRWSAEQILEEHAFLADLNEHEIPAVAPLTLKNGSTLGQLDQEQIYFAVFPKQGGRSPDELSQQDAEQIGRLLARLHAVGKAKEAKHRLKLTADSYGKQSRDFLADHPLLPFSVRRAFLEVSADICDLAESKLAGLTVQRVHGDCHLGNLLWGREGYFWVDFDDMLVAAPAQDLWLMVPDRDDYSRRLLEQLLRGYEQMNHIEAGSLAAIESFRSLRMLHFSAWVSRRWEDPAFKRAFPMMEEEQYWHQLVMDLQKQLSAMDDPHLWGE